MSDLVTAPLKLAAAPASYAFVGDSHAAIFEGLIFTNDLAETPVQRYLLTKGRWQSYFRAARFFREGCLDEWFTRTLRDLRFIGVSAQDALPMFPALPTHSESGGEREERFAPAKPAERVLVVCCGEVDAREATHAIGDGSDVDLDPPYDLRGLPEFVPARVFSEAEMREFIRARYVEPLFDGLAALRTAGYSKLFLYALPPPTIAQLPHFKPARMRYKMSVLFNRMYEEFCRENGVRLLSIWDEVTADGLRSPLYDLDGVHLNLAAAEIAVNKLRMLLNTGERQP